MLTGIDSKYNPLKSGIMTQGLFIKSVTEIAKKNKKGISKYFISFTCFKENIGIVLPVKNATERRCAATAILLALLKFKNMDLLKESMTGINAASAPAGAGKPKKKCFRLEFSPVFEQLNLASLIAIQITKTIATGHPKIFKFFKFQRYIINAGATPKLTRSAKESSCAPNKDSEARALASLPSSPSKIAENITAKTAASHFAKIANLIDVKPKHILKKVIALGEKFTIPTDLPLTNY